MVQSPHITSQEVKDSFGGAIECALERGNVQALEELCAKKILTVNAVEVPGYNVNAYGDLVSAMEKLKLLEFPHIAQLEHD